MKRFNICILLIFASLLSLGQNELFWYHFKSVATINAEQGKNALVIFRINSTSVQSSFNDKNDIFSISAFTPIDLPLLITTLNDHGYFIADLTTDRFHHPYCLIAGYYFQLALLYCHSPQVFIESEIPKIVLTNDEYDALSSAQKTIMNNSPFLFLTQQ